MKFYAHSTDNPSKDDWQTLENHLNKVAALAESFASDFGCGAIAHALGLLHDAGKISQAFQKRLEGSPEQVDHSVAGALIALNDYGAEIGTLLAFILTGHHGGLPNKIKSGKKSPLEKRLGAEVPSYDSFFDYIELNGISLPSLEKLQAAFKRERNYGHEKPNENLQVFAFYILIKMLYSCLVDADHLDTEAFCAPEKAYLRNISQPSLETLSLKLDEHLARFSSSDKKHSLVNNARASILDDCKNAGDSNTGLFTLTVPTGGGKTLSSLAFALRHAIINGQRRVIFAIPFTSIVEQTATVFREIFGDDAILEHHSNLAFTEEEGGGEKLKQRLAMQNWDAPIIVTTNVQFFESLYANKPSRCRKLHNIANSVVILDEAQTLPDSLLKPSLAALEELSLGYNTSIVLCTATQPALYDHWPFGASPNEIIKDRSCFEDAFENRINFENLGAIEEDDLAEKLTQIHQVLCIVGTKRVAQQLFKKTLEKLYPEEFQNMGFSGFARGVFHLSTWMTPSHRGAVLEEIRSRLKADKQCIVVSTQLIEAGVDVDFPIVFREIAGLDSMVQAAGRCNREGRRDKGTVYLFEYLLDGKIKKSNSWLEKMKELGRSTLAQRNGMLDKEAVTQFFEARYRTEDLDVEGIYKELTDKTVVMSVFNYSFEEYASKYQLIDNDDIALFVPWDEKGKLLLDELKRSDFPAAMTKKLQGRTVNVSPYIFEEYAKAGYLELIEPFWVLDSEALGLCFYDKDTGLLKPGEEEMQTLLL